MRVQTGHSRSRFVARLTHVRGHDLLSRDSRPNSMADLGIYGVSDLRRARICRRCRKRRKAVVAESAVRRGQSHGAVFSALKSKSCIAS